MGPHFISFLVPKLHFLNPHFCKVSFPKLSILSSILERIITEDFSCRCPILSFSNLISHSFVRFSVKCFKPSLVSLTSSSTFGLLYFPTDKVVELELLLVFYSVAIFTEGNGLEGLSQQSGSKKLQEERYITNLTHQDFKQESREEVFPSLL